MDRNKLFGIFTGTHLTILAGIAMTVPGALFAAGTFTSVVIQDTAGRQVTVVGGKLNVYDPVVDPLIGYASNPANYVKADVSCGGASNNPTLYTVPTGKALILKSANFTFYSGTAGADNYAYLEADSNFVAGIESGDVSSSQSADFGSGVYAKTSLSISCSSTAGSYLTAFTGYLVPSNAVPAEAVATGSAPRLVKNGKQL